MAPLLTDEWIGNDYPAELKRSSADLVARKGILHQVGEALLALIA